MAKANQEVTGFLMRKEEQEVLPDVTITPRGIPIRMKIIGQIHKDDNERIMRTKEKQEEFNMKLMQSLN